MKLSKRGLELLKLIDSRCGADGRYFMPLASDPVSGAGDASCLLSLERKGLTEKAHYNDYTYRITDLGKSILASLIGR